MDSSRTRPLSPAEQAIVLEEEALHRSVNAALSEEHARGSYFAHMRLRAAGRCRDVLLGHEGFVSRRHDIHIVDWRNAPMARVFFHYEEGDEYEVRIDGRTLEGALELRRILSFDGDQLATITTPAGTLHRGPDGRWYTSSPDRAPTVNGPLPEPHGPASETSALATDAPVPRFGTGATREPPPPVSALLDATQSAAIERDDRRPLLILGGAGGGKTTVALHRLAVLHHRRPHAYPQEDIAVIVPEGGLARLIEVLLGELGMHDVRVYTFDQWVVPNARRVLRDLPRRVRTDASASIIRFKRHPALHIAIQAYVAQLEAALAERLDRGMVGGGRIAQAFHGCPGPTPLDRLHQLKPKLLKGLKKAERKALEERFREEEVRLYRSTPDRLKLLGDAALLQQAIDAANGDLTPGMMYDVLDRTRRQFSLRTEHAYQDVDADRLQTVDGREIDADTPDDPAESADVEDLPILLELLRLKTGAMRGPSSGLTAYRHMVIDEAQDLAPLELGVLGSALKPEASLTIAGDQAQQIDPTTGFSSWDEVLRALRIDAADTVHLEASYRCPRPVIELAYQVLGPYHPRPTPRAVRDGAPVLRSVYPTSGHRAIALIGELSRLLEREPRARVAIITGAPDQAGQLYDALRSHLPVRLAQDGRFTFKPGLDITDVSEVKGLEFDYVVLPDVSPDHYPDTPAARRMLHVAVTRAIHQLWVMAVGRPASILPPEDQGAPGIIR